MTKLENLGIPAVAVATGEFRTAARAQASALGRADYDPVYVAHPIQDQTPEEIAARADAAIPEIMRALGIEDGRENTEHTEHTEHTEFTE